LPGFARNDESIERPLLRLVAAPALSQLRCQSANLRRMNPYSRGGKPLKDPTNDQEKPRT
jgi:hypothetical protein